MPHHQPTPEESQAIETGARSPSGWTKRLLIAVATVWSLLQLWVASPLPFEIGIGVFNDTELRAIHLGFALFLAYAWFPARHHRSATIPLQDWLFALLAAASSIYLLVNYHALAGRAGAPTSGDLIVGCGGILLLLEATRRCLGRPLAVVALIFLAYTFAGPWLPDLLAHKGASLSRVVSHQWLSSEGVFGVALGVSASFIFLFVLFGTLLEQAGGGQWFIQLSYALVGHLRGGPAKAAVLSSGFTGMVSGSSIANVVTTGTFTIPLMKKAGFSATKAGAIEVAASTNGQIMPPVMGAAAFLMVEYLNIPYTEVIRHALLPAVIAYIALFYLVHLEALKSGMPTVRQRHPQPLRQRLLGSALALTTVIITTALLYWLFASLDTLFGSHAWLAASILLSTGYLALLYYGQRQHQSQSDESILDPGSGIRAGLYYLIPIGVLVWCLMVLRLSPATSVFYATVSLTLIMLTQRPLLALLAGQRLMPALRTGCAEWFDGLQVGARNMITIAIATATAGIVVGTVSLTGIGQLLGELIETLAMGSIMLMLLLTALVCMLLGMGLPTTANYIVVSTLMAGVIAQLTANQGLVIPLVAIHLFVFYFGILADDTPPVGLAAYAAAGISGADPIKTGLQSFYYDIRTVILPFVFVFNTDLLLIGVTHPLHYLWTALTATLAMLLFVSALQGWMLTRLHWWQRVLLLLIALSLFRPGFWRDQFYPPSISLPAIAVHDITSSTRTLTLAIEEQTDNDRRHTRNIVFTLPAGTEVDPLTSLGLITHPDGNDLLIDDIEFMSAAEQAGLEPGYARRITGLIQPQAQPNKAWFTIPFLLLLLPVWWSQRRRAGDTHCGSNTAVNPA